MRNSRLILPFLIIAAWGAGLAAEPVTPIPGYRPPDDLSQTQGTADKRWKTVYTGNVSDGKNAATIKEIRDTIDSSLNRDHAELTLESRSAPGQHPIAAIIGLYEALEAKAPLDVATQYRAGLMSAPDKTKLNSLTPDLYIVKGDDSLTDARTPLAHAETHVVGGSDPLPLADGNTLGLAKADGITLTAVNGVLSARPEAAAIFNHGQLQGRDSQGQHPIGAIEGLQDALDSKAVISHAHPISDVTELQTILDIKADKSALSNYATASALSTGLAEKANATHGHGIADVTGLQAALDAKPSSASLGGYTPTGRTIATTAPLTGGGTLAGNLTLGVSNASTSAKGAVQLSSAVNSTSETLAATPAAVKVAYDLAAGKAAASHTHTTSQVSGLDAALAAKFPLASPAFTGTPTVPTAAAGTNTTQAASTAFVTAAVNTRAASYLPLAGGTLTGNLAIPATGNISFGSGVSPKLNLYGTSYQIGIESNTLFYRSSGIHRFYVNTAEAAYINLTDIYHGGVGLKTTLNGKANTSHTHTTGQVSGLDATLAAKAPLASPAFTGNVSATGEIRTTSANSYRHAVGNYGTFWRQDGNTLYLMLTNSGDQYGNWNSHRPFWVDLASGKAYLTSPGLTGTPTAPTAATGTNTDQIATTRFVQNSMTSSGGAPMPTTAAGIGQWTNLIGTYIKGSLVSGGVYNYTHQIALPSGGTWAYFTGSTVGIAAGGTAVSSSTLQTVAGLENTTTKTGLAWRIQ